MNEPRQSNETMEQYNAFKYYFDLKGDRSYSKVAMKFNKSISTIEKWGKTFNWQDRVARVESEARNKEAEKQLIEGEVDYIQRNLKGVKLAIFKHIQGMQSDRMKISYGSFIDLVNLEHKLRTGYDKQIDIKVNLSSLSNEELIKRINDIANNVKRIAEIKGYDVNDSIEDADYIEVQTNEYDNKEVEQKEDTDAEQ